MISHTAWLSLVAADYVTSLGLDICAADNSVYSAVNQYNIYTCFEFEDNRTFFAFRTDKGSMNSCKDLVWTQCLQHESNTTNLRSNSSVHSYIRAFLIGLLQSYYLSHPPLYSFFLPIISTCYYSSIYCSCIYFAKNYTKISLFLSIHSKLSAL